MVTADKAEGLRLRYHCQPNGGCPRQGPPARNETTVKCPQGQCRVSDYISTESGLSYNEWAWSLLQVAWAPPKSINEDKDLKQFWDVDAGAAYIPWGQIPSDLEPIKAGGEAMIDESTLPAAAISAAQAKAVAPPQPVAEEEPAPLPGLGGIVNTSIPPHVALSGGALPPIQPGQILPVSQPNMSAPPPSAVTQLPNVGQPGLQLPGQVPGAGQVPGPGQVPAGLPPGVQLMMQNARQMQGEPIASLVPVDYL